MIKLSEYYTCTVEVIAMSTVPSLLQIFCFLAFLLVLLVRDTSFKPFLFYLIIICISQSLVNSST